MKVRKKKVPKKYQANLPPPPIDPCGRGFVSILAISENMKNGWNRFPENAGNLDKSKMRWTNDDGTVYPDDYNDADGLSGTTFSNAP